MWKDKGKFYFYLSIHLILILAPEISIGPATNNEPGVDQSV
jgi:hypothetical protein